MRRGPLSRFVVVALVALAAVATMLVAPEMTSAGVPGANTFAYVVDVSGTPPPGTTASGSYECGGVSTPVAVPLTEDTTVSVPIISGVTCHFELASVPSYATVTHSCTDGSATCVDDQTISFGISQTGTITAKVDMSAASAGGGVYVLGPAGTTITDASTSLPPPTSPLPPGYTFPFGLVTFRVDGLELGAMAYVTLVLPAPVTHLFKFLDGVHTLHPDAMFAGSTVTVALTDGGYGDADHVADGAILHVATPAIAVIEAEPTFTG